MAVVTDGRRRWTMPSAHPSACRPAAHSPAARTSDQSEPWPHTHRSDENTRTQDKGSQKSVHALDLGAGVLELADDRHIPALARVVLVQPVRQRDVAVIRIPLRVELVRPAPCEEFAGGLEAGGCRAHDVDRAEELVRAVAGLAAWVLGCAPGVEPGDGSQCSLERAVQKSRLQGAGN